MRYSIKVAAELTGLSPGTLRAWERRYGAVVPARDPSGRRSYGSDELTRLQLLHKAVDQGHTIGKLVALSDSELRELIAESISHATGPHPAAENLYNQLIAAVEDYDAIACERILGLAVASLSPFDFVRDVLSRTLREVGERWHKGEMTIAQERILSSCARRLLLAIIQSQFSHRGHALLLFGTLSGETHELGSLSAAFLAGRQGLSVNYLGTDLPASEMSRIAVKSRAAAVGISVSINDENKYQQVLELCEDLPAQTRLWVGGRAASAITLRGLPANALPIRDLSEFEVRLQELRYPGLVKTVPIRGS